MTCDAVKRSSATAVPCLTANLGTPSCRAVVGMRFLSARQPQPCRCITCSFRSTCYALHVSHEWKRAFKRQELRWGHGVHLILAAMGSAPPAVLRQALLSTSACQVSEGLPVVC